MADYYGYMMTDHEFSVIDPKAFEDELHALGVPTTWDTYSGEGTICVDDGDNEYWYGGYNGTLAEWVAPQDDDSDEYEVDMVEVIQKHLRPDSWALITEVGHEKLRYVIGYTVLITKEAAKGMGLESVQQELREELGVDSLSRDKEQSNE